jgi:hypothetical protein
MLATLEIELSAGSERLHAMIKEPASVLGLRVNAMSNLYMQKKVFDSLHSVFHNTPLGDLYNNAIIDNIVTIVEMLLLGQNVDDYLTALFRVTYIDMAKGRSSNSKSNVKIHNLYAIGTAETLEKTHVHLIDHNFTYEIEV